MPVAGATAATKAALSIMPSMPMLSTPARSLTSSPIAAKSSGVASRIDEAMKTAISVSSSCAPSLRVDQNAAPASTMTIRPWITTTTAVGTLRRDLHADAAGAEEAEEHRPSSTSGTEPRASRPTTRPSKP